ncbi:TetR/AcrR family transcriptional regulator [Salinithrix halophila]|uniref:TetR/AcrR family transcriptional regulator n=1 Tax=Salinithrix halophila TaxID=1485204 RepID=A0ABV8JBE8_9BACL
MPKVIDHDEYREELLSQCLELFAREGYGALSMRKIADALDVSTGTLYHYFSSKEDLFHQLVEVITCQDLFDAETALKDAETLDARIDALLRFIEERESSFLNQVFIWMDYYRNITPEAEPGPREALIEYEEGIARLLGTEDPEIARFILVMMNGLVIQRYLDGGRTSLEGQSALIRDFLIQRKAKGSL